MLGLWLAVSGSVGAVEKILVADVPHVQQKPDFCGEACVEMLARKAGRAITQDDVFNRAGVNPLFGRGCRTPELAAVMKTIGFRPGSVWTSVEAAQAARDLDAQWQALVEDLARGVPSIVCMHYDERPASSEHFRLILGYDPAADEVLYHEPAVEQGAYLRMKKAVFLQLWPLKYEEARWTIVRLRGEAGNLSEAVRPPGFTPADYAQHVMRLKTKNAGPAFTLVLVPPFVVIGDSSRDEVRRTAGQTVSWAVEKLRKDFFSRNPSEILDVWLFKDKDSYEQHTRSIFNETPTTPFGFFSQEHKALIMNIATGGGTLVHEIVHPFMRADFPRCPAWFNEGLGSLFEQSCEKDGHIRGLTNWRLAGLQETIREKKLPSFENLLGMGDDAFYSDDRGTHYAQARYLCYYLQEKSLLTRFYREFKAGVADDSTGLKTLGRVLDADDWPAFQQKWETFVLKLAFP